MKAPYYHFDLEYVEKVCRRYGQFSFQGVVGKRPVALYGFTNEGSLEVIDGYCEPALHTHLSELPERPGKGTMAFYVLPEFLKWSPDVEVFFFNADLAAQDVEMQELVVFHEVCHLLDIRECWSTLIELTPEDYRIGEIINSEANKPGIDTVHNQTFGALLNAFLREKDPERRRTCLCRAMQWNLLEDWCEGQDL